MPLPKLETLDTQRLSIRALHANDLADLFEINSNTTVTAFLPYAAWQTLDDGRAWITRMQTMGESGTAQQLVIALRSTGKVVGTLLVFRYDEGSARAEIGYVLGQAHWHQGLMREALTAFCTHAFTHMKLRRLEAEVNPANTASCALLERAGFVREGLLRQRWVDRGEDAYDTAFYGLLAQKYQVAQ